MSKIKQTAEEFGVHLDEQLGFLEKSAKNFDDGDDSEAKRMAVSIRALLHDTPKSQSLLKLLGIKDAVQFWDTSSIDDNIIGPYEGLVLKSIGPSGGKYVAPLDDLPPDHASKQVSFDEYWNKDIFIDNAGNHFSRKTLILAIANKDGGAHIDSELDSDYVALTKNNSLGWVYGNDLKSGPLENPSFATVRQIAHEILKTLIPNYPEKKLLNSQSSVVLGGIHITEGAFAGRMVNVSQKRDVAAKIGRNEKCPCGSNLKYKKCHGK